MLLFNTITAITADLYISFKAMFKFKIQDSQKEKKKKKTTLVPRKIL